VRTEVESDEASALGFRLGEIGNLPVADNTVDIVISNYVFNLSPNKRRVFEEAFRVLKTLGRLMVLDIVLLKKLPEAIEKNVAAYIGCLSGAIMKDEYIEVIRKAGFQEAEIIEESHFPIEYMTNDPTAKAVIKKSKTPIGTAREIVHSVASVKVYGVKPKK